MKINKILVLSVSALAVCGTLSAQDLRGVVRDADNQPLVGASVYWEGTTIGASTDAEGAFLLHRVKGYDNLVASYLGFVYEMIGLPQEIFTPLFAMARIVGWCAHRNEELTFDGKRIIRPAYKNVLDDLAYIPIKKR